MKKLLCILLLATCLCTPTIMSSAWAGDDGTITINGLVWLKDAGCLGPATWDGAQNVVASLASGQCGLSDKSTAGQWRLPTAPELWHIYMYRSSFSGIKTVPYWSSTTPLANSQNRAYILYMANRTQTTADKSKSFYILPVRVNHGT